MNKLPGKKMNRSLTPKEEIPKNSAIPPQTPCIDLSVEDFLSFFCNVALLSYISEKLIIFIGFEIIQSLPGALPIQSLH